MRQTLDEFAELLHDRLLDNLNALITLEPNDVRGYLTVMTRGMMQFPAPVALTLDMWRMIISSLYDLDPASPAMSQTLHLLSESLPPDQYKWITYSLVRDMLQRRQRCLICEIVGTLDEAAIMQLAPT